MPGLGLRVVTYNVHKCRGLDGRTRPQRIARVLGELGADVIGLQEVLSVAEADPPEDQAHYLAHALEPKYHYELGENRKLRGGAYGNVVLSRLPIRGTQNYDITRPGREKRGCLRADLELPGGGVLHVFNLHLGTGFFERRYQAELLVREQVLRSPDLRGPRIVLGDFNEWTRGHMTRMLRREFEEVDLRHQLHRRRTYPGFLPLVHLDHIYYDRALHLQKVGVHRSRTAFVASDHLPLVADFLLP